MKHDIAGILDNCIEALRRGKTANDCLATYPDAAADLAPLLQTATRISAAPKVQVPESVMLAGKAAFLQEAAILRAESQRPQTNPKQRLGLVANPTFVLPRLRPLAWAPALSLVLAVILVLSTATSAFAASRSLPDDALYPVKLAAEQVQLALTTNPVERADLTMGFAERRGDEIATLSQMGRQVDPPTIERLSAESRQALASIGQVNDDAMKPRLQRYLAVVEQQQNLLNQVGSVPSLSAVVAAALAIAEENEKLASTAINDPSVLKEPPQRTTRGVTGAPQETPTSLPTPDPGHMRTIVVPTASPTKEATASPTPQPQPTQAPATATQPATATSIPPTSSPLPTLAPSATALPLVQFSGVIESVGASDWVVGGKPVHINGQTKIAGGAARVGASADIVAVAAPDQPLLAISINVRPLVVLPATQTVHGIIFALGQTTWNIGGQTVAVDASTVINGTPAIGSLADATGTRKGSDVLTATSITIKGLAPEVQVQGRIESLAPDSWVVAGQTVAIVAGLTSIAGTPMVGATASITALRTDSGSLIARRISVQPAIVEEEFDGIVNRIDGDTWTINGRRVVKTASTQLDESTGRAQVGSRVHVRGTLQADGSIQATSIRVLAAGSNGRQGSPTVAPSPTMVTSPLSSPTPTTAAPTKPVPPTATPTRSAGVATATPTPLPPTATPSPTLTRPAASPTAAAPAATATRTSGGASVSPTAAPPTMTPRPGG